MRGPSTPVAWLLGTAALAAALHAVPGEAPAGAAGVARSGPGRCLESGDVAGSTAARSPASRRAPLPEATAVGPSGAPAGPGASMGRAALDVAALARLRALEAQGPSGEWDLRGETLAVERGGAVEVHRLGAGEPDAGAPPRRFAGRRPRLSPDGEMVAIERPVGTRGDAADAANAGEAALVVVDAVNGKEIALPGFAAGEVQWSPDGRRLAVVLRVGVHADVFVFDVGRASLYQLTESGGGSPRWLGRGSRLLYEAPRPEGGFGLFVRDGGGLGAARLFWDSPAEPPASGDVV